jgi:hypothetical protein
LFRVQPFRYRAGVGVEEGDKAREQALEIVGRLMERARAGPVVLRVQSEIVDESKMLDQTVAGKVVERDVVAGSRGFETQLCTGSEKGYSGSATETGCGCGTDITGGPQPLIEKGRNPIGQRDALRKTLVGMHYQEEGRLMEKVNEMEAVWRESMQKKEQELGDIDESLYLS